MKTIAAFILLLTITTAGTSQSLKPLKLYPNGIPNSKPAPAGYTEKTEFDHTLRITKVTEPTLTPYLPEKSKANGAAVIICPGGAYGFLAAEHEGADIAKAFNNIGVTAFVLKYRLPDDAIMIDKKIGPLQDAQRAIQMVREGAAKWGVNPSRIGIIGFSAGGHLAATAGTHFDKALIENKNNTSLRPDFMILVYPVITYGPMGFPFMNEILLGKNPSQQNIDYFSNEKWVTANTPPTFLTHTTDDPINVQNSLLFYEALVNAKVKAELHAYQEGGHGYGLKNTKIKSSWFEQLTNWMYSNGWLTK